MTEEKVKKRAWVKNAAIIFLAIMLVFTFFSNTIMNRALPEAAVEHVRSGTIATRIRGSGTVTANESFQVISEQTREVLSVLVRVGDIVNAGDTLLIYSEADSQEIIQAQEALDALVLSHQKMLLDAVHSDYAREVRDINLALQALYRAIADRDAIDVVTPQEIGTAQNNVNTARADVQLRQAIIANLEAQLAHTSIISAELESERTRLTSIQTRLSNFEAELDALMERQAAWTAADNLVRALQRELNDLIADGADQSDIALAQQALNNAIAARNAIGAVTPQQIATAYNNVNLTRLERSTQLHVISNLENQLADTLVVSAELEAERARLAPLEIRLANFEEVLANLTERREARRAAEDAVSARQREHEDLVFALEDRKTADGRIQASLALDLADMRRRIDAQRAILDGLRAGGEGAVVTSRVNGVVRSVNISAGNRAEVGMTLLVVEVPDRGYGLNFPVTIEQSRRVQPGDIADVLTFFWGDPIRATLIGISPDPQNPNVNRILHFHIEGEVESGTQLDLSIGERGVNFEFIVPNSAVRNDINGSFVLVVSARRGPLGNRYFAMRVAVNVLASDDTRSAVSGELTNMDMVITTSSRPIEPGAQIRFPD